MDGKTETLKKRKKQSESKELTKKVKNRSERKANFFIIKFLTDFSRSKLEKDKNK